MPFSTWERPEQSMQSCLARAGIGAGELDAVAYSYDPRLLSGRTEDITTDAWEPLRTLYAQRADRFLSTVLAGLDPTRVVHVPHHVAHAASAHLASPYRDAAVLVLDGRGETASHLAVVARDGRLEVLHTQALPHSTSSTTEPVCRCW